MNPFCPKQWKYAQMVEKLLPLPTRADPIEPSPPKALPVGCRYGQKSFDSLHWTNGITIIPITKGCQPVYTTLLSGRCL